MRWTPVIFALAAIVVAACQPASEESEADFTSGPAPETAPDEGDEPAAPGADDAATDASADPAQQSAPPPSETGDMGDAQSSEESVEPDSPTMFQ